jgi:hypothetical protein
MRHTLVFMLLLVVVLGSCTEEQQHKAPTKALTEIERVQAQVDSLEEAAQEGDLIVRLGDDMLSYSIRFLSQKDPSYSHTGIVVVKNGKKLVCHIYPDEIGADTIRYDPIDSFANPAKNFLCGLYRHTLSEVEKSAFLKDLMEYQKKKVHFDRLYDLKSDDKVYCSEMIAKSLSRSTGGRIKIEQSRVPKKMLPLMSSYFKNEKISKKQLSEDRYIAIDDLYLHPACRLLMKVNLQPSF